MPYIDFGQGKVSSFRITSFTSDYSGVLVERGAAIPALTLAWSYNDAVASQSIAPYAPVVDSLARSIVLTDVVASGDLRFTLNAVSASGSKSSSSLVIEAVDPIFFGDESQNKTPTQNDVFLNGTLLAKPMPVLEVDMPIGDGYVYVAIPSAWGKVKKIVECTCIGELDLTSDFTLTKMQLSMKDGVSVGYDVWVFNYMTAYDEPQKMKFVF